MPVAQLADITKQLPSHTTAIFNSQCSCSQQYILGLLVSTVYDTVRKVLRQYPDAVEVPLQIQQVSGLRPQSAMALSEREESMAPNGRTHSGVVNVPQERVVCIEHPCIVRNVDKGVQSLGGEHTMQQVRRSDIVQRFPPNPCLLVTSARWTNPRSCRDFTPTGSIREEAHLTRDVRKQCAAPRGSAQANWKEAQARQR